MSMTMRATKTAKQGQKVYIAQSALGFHKIGFSKHPPQRIRQLDIPGVVDLRLLHTIPTMFAPQAERLLHDALQEYRVNREWFRLPEDLVQAICECKGEHDILALCGVFL